MADRDSIVPQQNVGLRGQTGSDGLSLVILIDWFQFGDSTHYSFSSCSLAPWIS
jgi:hypothetical protein